MHYLNGHELWRIPTAAEKMFSDRSKQFRDRLCWNVKVDKTGFETDQYDRANPLYIIMDSKNNPHLGSMRLLPTTGPTMTNDFFISSLGLSPIQNETTWESSRFCVAPEAPRKTSIELLAGASAVLRSLGAKHLIATFDLRMMRVYKAQEIFPEILGSMETVEGQVFVGRWELKGKKFYELCRSCYLSSPLQEGLDRSTNESVLKEAMHS